MATLCIGLLAKHGYLRYIGDLVGLHQTHEFRKTDSPFGEGEQSRVGERNRFYT